MPALQNKSKVKSANQEIGAPGKGKIKSRRPTERRVGRYRNKPKATENQDADRETPAKFAGNGSRYEGNS